MKNTKSPFLFGQIVQKEHFVNRQNELKTLNIEIESGIHQIIISPRRWGKSSFIKQAAHICANPKIVFCFIDLFSIRTEKEFFEQISKQLLHATNSNFEDIRKTIKDNLNSLLPKLTLSPDPTQSFDIDFNWKPQSETIEAVLNLAEKIAIKKKIRIVMCFDEFQGISDFSESKSFQKLLRSYWQNHKHVTYCLYGSKRSMMEQMFQKQNMPFYRFGTTTFLQKINEQELVNYIVLKFKKTKKIIESDIAVKIVKTMACHSYYVQQMAHFVWLHTITIATNKEWLIAVDNLFSQNLILFQKDFESLSIAQIKCLKALIENDEIKITAGETIKKYDLGSSSTVLRALDGLEKKEIIDRFTGKIEFVDPGFKLWIKQKIFI